MGLGNLNRLTERGLIIGLVIGMLVAAFAEPAEARRSSRGARNPGGRTGTSRQWRPEWTRMFNTCFQRHGQNLARKQPTDRTQFCAQTNVPPAKFWLSIFIPLAEKESGFNEKARGQNGRQVPLGLYQMDVGDMRRHKCVGSDPTDANMAICCAVKIADNLSKRHNAISNGKKGILASFWQPVRSGMGGNGRTGRQARRINNTANLNYIKTKSKQLCTSPETDAPGGSPQDNGGVLQAWLFQGESDEESCGA